MLIKNIKTNCRVQIVIFHENCSFIFSVQFIQKWHKSFIISSVVAVIPDGVCDIIVVIGVVISGSGSDVTLRIRSVRVVSAR